MPSALQTLARPTQPQPINIEKASRFISACGFGINGQETKEESEKLTELLRESVRWLASWLEGREPYWLVMVGLSGTGKSMLTRRIAQYCIDHGHAVFERTVRDNMDAMTQDTSRVYSYAQEGFPFMEWRNLVPHSSENQTRFSRAQSDWFKCIDDLKSQTGESVIMEGETGIQPKRFEANAAGDLLDARLRKWTVINTNLTRNQLALFWDVRIASRLTRGENTLVDLSGVRDFCFRK